MGRCSSSSATTASTPRTSSTRNSEGKNRNSIATSLAGRSAGRSPQPYFFFTAYEGLRQDQGKTSTVIVPTMAARQGILPSGAVVTVSPIVVPYLDLYPVPGDGNTVIQNLGNGTVQLASEANENPQIDGDMFTLKLDHRLSDGKAGMLSGRTITMTPPERISASCGVTPS